MKLKSTVILTAALLAAPAHAAITYVDAVVGFSGNTFATGGSPADMTWIDTTMNSASDNNTSWVLRFGGTPGWTQHNGGDVISGQVSSITNDLGEITTRISGLADGTYNVWVFFWEQTVSNTQNWVIDAGLTSGSLTTFSSPAGPVAGTDSASPVAASTLSFSNAPSVLAADGNQSMFGVNLGQVSVESGSDIHVYVDKLFGTGSANRTIYDGVGYELIPEPSAALLGALGALCLLRRRRQ